MKTRMQKYYDEDNNNVLLREHKNKELYEDIKGYEDLNYDVNNNETVIANNSKNIDVEQIKKILDTKYNQNIPKRKSIVAIESPEKEEMEGKIEDEANYDINAILEKARSEKDLSYDEERVKKIRDTQYDILNSLNMESKTNEEEEEEDLDEEHTKLMNLINTITAREKDFKELNNKEMDPLDILVDLKGSDDTEIVNGIKESESIGETSPIMSLEEADKIKPQILEKQKQEENTLQFTQSDFDDFNDLKKEVKSSRALIFVIIGLIVIVFVGGLLFFLNHFLELNWF